jgi:hypothetical protein
LFGPNQTALDLNEIVLAEEVQISWNTSQWAGLNISSSS